jgi:flagellar biosynthesis protein FliQ
MSKSTLVLVPLLLVVVAGLLITGGWAIHRIGWTEGYAVGAGVAAGEASPVPYAPTGLSYIGLFLTAGLAFVVLMAFVSKLMGLWAFRTFAGPWMLAHKRPVGPSGPNGERWAAHWHRYPRHAPPWWWGWEQPGEEQSGDAVPGTKGAGSETSS